MRKKKRRDERKKAKEEDFSKLKRKMYEREFIRKMDKEEIWCKRIK